MRGKTKYVKKGQLNSSFIQYFLNKNLASKPLTICMAIHANNYCEQNILINKKRKIGNQMGSFSSSLIVFYPKIQQFNPLQIVLMFRKLYVKRHIVILFITIHTQIFSK